MARKVQIFFLLIFLGVIHLAAQTPFICNGDFYLSLNSSGTNSQFIRVVRDPQTSTVVFNTINSNTGAVVNAIGYRVTDNLIYGVNPGSANLYRIDATGQATFLTQLQHLKNL